MAGSDQTHIMALQEPSPVDLPEPVQAVAAGHHHTLCLGHNGQVWAFGDNAQWQLGLGKKASTHVSQPKLLSTLTGALHA